MGRFVKIEPKFCDLMTMSDFCSGVESNLFTDNDGFGYYSDGIYEDTREEIYPSMLKNKTLDISKAYVVWYDK